jgi:hypothetical protein
MMKIKALLCDHAEVSGNKLFISGANINLLGVRSADVPLRVNFALAIVAEIPWNATNEPHTMSIELVSDQGGTAERVPLSDDLPAGQEEADKGMIFAQFNVGRGPNMKRGEDTLLPIALPFFGLPLPRPGGYFMAIRIDGTELDRVSFRAEVLTQGGLDWPMP